MKDRERAYDIMNANRDGAAKNKDKDVPKVQLYLIFFVVHLSVFCDCFACISGLVVALSVLTLLVGHQEEHLACEN